MTDAARPRVPDAHDRWQEATIEQIAVATPTVKTFVLRPKQFASFLPGQHIDVRLTALDGYEAHRSYSITSAPDNSGTFELAIEELRSGDVSPYFHEVSEVGDTVEVRGPFTTHFVWRPEHDGRVLLVGGGSGVAPLMSMVRHRAHLAAAGTALPPMTLAYSARSWADLIFRDELVAHQRQQPAFGLVLALTRDATQPPGTPAVQFQRRLDAAALREVVSAMPELPTTSFVCGNNGFVGTVADALVDIGIPAGSVRTERYGG